MSGAGEGGGAGEDVGADGDPRGLPWVDEHAGEISAPASQVWPALLRTVERMTAGAGAPRYARAVGCADTEAGGPRPLEVGSTIPGFHVVATTPERLLVLAGSHRFSDYALTFRLEPLGAVRTRVVAETRADFPGLKGRAYRAAVIGTRMHVLVVRRVLRGVRRRVESAPAAGAP
ncbi:MAG TPA: hypothetical protein VMF55_05910 [Solirubrobacterales bacterium]|nr:hypothetical protein [Solirubrobacterales bacterium]